MAHIPHLFLPGIWTGETIDLDPDQQSHLSKVLRRSSSSKVSYTNGCGQLGEGSLHNGQVLRGSELTIDRPASRLRVAVAPPKSRGRVRMIVEKLAELGVDEICWLKTRFGQAQPPDDSRSLAWAISALEQSRGVWLTELSGIVGFNDLTEPILVADPAGMAFKATGETGYTLVIGPEGGFHPDEVPDNAVRISLSDRILRTETAAIVGAATVLSHLR